MKHTQMLAQLGKKIGIIGLGKSGHAAKDLLLNLGFAADNILLFDDKDPNAKFSDPAKLLAESPNSLIVSPGYPLRQSWLKDAGNRGVFITSEVELGFAFLGNEVTFGVTGSVGKSTVCALLRAGCLGDDPNCFLGGNFGYPLCDYISAVYLKKVRTPAKYLVLELSSYQLENFNSLSLDFSVITSLLPNHLERYDSLQDYYSTKLKLIPATKQQVILNKSGGDLPGTLLTKSDKFFWINRANLPSLKPSGCTDPLLVGDHNEDNLSLAIQLLRLAGLSEASIAGCYNFPGLEHRLENLGSYRGYICINDSKSTTVESVLVAAKGVRQRFSDERITLLLGGKDKGLPWEQLSSLSKLNNFNFVFFGECGLEIKNRSNLSGSYFPQLKSALDSIFYAATDGSGVLLLSPGGTSLDEFKSFEDRGNFFKSYLKSKVQNG